VKTPLALVFLSILIPSCADRDSTADSSTNPGYVPFSQRLAADQQRSANAFVADANGVWRPENDKRSSLEANRQSPYFKGKFQGSTYTAGEYSKTNWWGSKEFKPASTSYANTTDGSGFATRSRLQQQAARESSGQNFATSRFGTGSYATSSAREASVTQIGRTADAQTEVRRRTFTPPAMVDWQAQRALSLSQTKGLIGR
jgi:hypothetical protein